MPTHWESSKRPLFVRTVFVNGSRHAILSQEDPLCQSNAAPSSRKQSRPSSCQSFASTFSVNSYGSQESNLGKRFRNVKTDGNNNQWDQQENRVNNGGGSNSNKGDISSELQGCLVKLRLVLATHENKNKVKNERLVNGNQNGEKKSNQNSRQKENVKQKRKKSNHPKTNKKKSCDYYYHDSRGGALKEIDLKGYKEENNNYYSFNNENEDRNYYYLETTSKLSSSSSFNYCCEKDANLIEIRDICCFEGYHETRKENESILSRTSTTITSFVEKVERNHGNPPSQFFPTIQLPSNDISWNSLSSDSYFTRPFYNPLSERVLQWLDLASKRKENNAKLEKLNEEILSPSDNVERIFEGNTFLDENNIARYRDKTKSKKNKMLRSKSEGKTCKNTNYERKDKKREFIRQSTEKRSDSKDSDQEDEVRQENDVETALSNQIIQPEYPKFSKELNKLHKSMSQQDKCEDSSGTFSEVEKISTATDSTSSGIVVSDKIDSESSASSTIIIPEKARNESAVSLNLQESIMNSFNDVVTFKAGNKNDLEKHKPEQSTYSFTTYQYFPQAKPKTYQTTEERRGQLTRQAKLQESSEEDEDASLKARKIDCWNKSSVSVKQRRNAFSHRNSMFNKTIDCNSSRARREVLKRQKNRTPSLQQRDKDDEDSCPSENQSIIQAIFHSNPLPPQLQNKIPWLRDYQTGGKNMWPSEKGTNKPQLHIFMPAIPPKISEGTGDESISDCESLASEVCPCNEDWQVPEEA